MKYLNGSELADYIKERQARQVRALRQAWQVAPQLAIVIVGDNPVSDAYVRLKQEYGRDILVDTVIHRTSMDDVRGLIEELNRDDLVHGVIIQLPLPDVSATEEVLNLVDPTKDVDGLGASTDFESATAIAIDWLLAGYNIDLRGKRIGIVGQGRLVGKPLAARWATAGYDVSVFDTKTDDLANELRAMQVIVSGTGSPGLITEHMVQPGAVIVDAGTASEGGKLVGDVATSVRERDDITITPEKGGVGPLTVTALFDNVITAAKKVAEAKS